MDTSELLKDAATRAARYLASLADRRVAPDGEAVAALARLRTPLPGTGTAPDAVLAERDEAVSPATMAMAGPRFFGFVSGATMANATALAAARHRVLADAGWDVEAEGLFGAPPVQVVVGAEVHQIGRASCRGSGEMSAGGTRCDTENGL